MQEIKIGIVGGGYMGKRHAAAFAGVKTVFETRLAPKLEGVAAGSLASAETYRDAYGFARAYESWADLVADPEVDAVIVASPQSTHEEIALAAFEAGKHVLCEKPLSTSVESGARILRAAEASGCTHMVGFNYIRTPATQFAIKLIQEGRLGQITGYRGEHVEDFLLDPDAAPNWRCFGRATGCMGDLSPHAIHCAMALMGPIREMTATVEQVHVQRGGKPVENDDQAELTVRFESGVLGTIRASRIVGGRRMGYTYEVVGTKGTIRFDQEDQNALWFFDATDPPEIAGFRKIIAGPEHGDYWAFCDGPSHGTGYNAQILIQAKAFLEAIETGHSAWPSFRDGVHVDQVVDAAFAASDKRGWVTLDYI